MNKKGIARLTGAQEAKVIALRLGKPPARFANWPLRSLTNQVGALEMEELLRTRDASAKKVMLVRDHLSTHTMGAF